MNQCPHCHRRLISHMSPRCNWCGQEITDADYQAKADADREVFFAQQALHDAQSLARTESMLVNNGDPLSALQGRRSMWSVQPDFVPGTAQVNAASARVAAAQANAASARVAAAQANAAARVAAQDRAARTASAQAAAMQSGQIEPRFGTAVGQGNTVTGSTGEEQAQAEETAPDAEQPSSNRFQNLEL